MSLKPANRKEHLQQLKDTTEPPTGAGTVTEEYFLEENPRLTGPTEEGFVPVPLVL